MTGSMRWETPPPPGHGYRWPELAEQLRANPDEWLLVFEDGPVSVINAIRQASIAVLTPIRMRKDTHPGFEVRTRNNRVGPPKTADFYLRWYSGEEQ